MNVFLFRIRNNGIAVGLVHRKRRWRFLDYASRIKDRRFWERTLEILCHPQKMQHGKQQNKNTLWILN